MIYMYNYICMYNYIYIYVNDIYVCIIVYTYTTHQQNYRISKFILNLYFNLYCINSNRRNSAKNDD